MFVSGGVDGRRGSDALRPEAAVGRRRNWRPLARPNLTGMRSIWSLLAVASAVSSSRRDRGFGSARCAGPRFASACAWIDAAWPLGVSAPN